MGVGRRGEGEGMARVSEWFTMDPNKNCFWRGRGWGEAAGGGLG